LEEIKKECEVGSPEPEVLQVRIVDERGIFLDSETRKSRLNRP
jgi:hypothetical protein